MSEYDQDYYGWLTQQAALLRAGRLSEADIEHIAEELEDMGASEARGLQSQIERLIAHLLKWAYQPEQRAWSGNSWRASIRDARRRIQRRLKQSPGLRPELPAMFEDAYAGGKDWAITETNLPDDRFPERCPWTLEQVMDSEFWPDA